MVKNCKFLTILIQKTCLIQIQKMKPTNYMGILSDNHFLTYFMLNTLFLSKKCYFDQKNIQNHQHVTPN